MPSVRAEATSPTIDHGVNSLGNGPTDFQGDLRTFNSVPDIGADERFATNPGRVTHRDALIPQLQAEFGRFAVDDLLRRLSAAGVPAGRINTLHRVLSDPQVLHRQMVVEVEHPTAGTLKVLGVPYKFSRTPATVKSAPPLLGQHTGSETHESRVEYVEEYRPMALVWPKGSAGS